MSSPTPQEHAAAAEFLSETDLPPAAAPAADQAPVDPVVQHFKAVDLDASLASTAFLPMEKAAGLYVARLATPLLVQTPPLTLVSPLDDEDGTPLPHAHLSLPRGFRQFAEAAEERVLAACLANKAAWFRRPMEDQSLRASFKQFCKAGGDAEGGTLKIKVPRDALVFDSQGQVLCRADVQPGTRVRALLELSRVCFGRTEFGAMWSLVQAQTAPAPPPPPRCLIDPDADSSCGQAPADPDSEVHEFL